MPLGQRTPQADQDMKQSLEEEWEHDSGGDGSISLAEFSEVRAMLPTIVLSEPYWQAMFELADLWVPSTEVMEGPKKL